MTVHGIRSTRTRIVVNSWGRAIRSQPKGSHVSDALVKHSQCRQPVVPQTQRWAASNTQRRFYIPEEGDRWVFNVRSFKASGLEVHGASLHGLGFDISGPGVAPGRVPGSY